jgi:hypothetical protein
LGLLEARWRAALEGTGKAGSTSPIGVAHSARQKFARAHKTTRDHT